MLTQISLKPHTLLGTSEESLTLPLPDGSSVEVGPVTATLDHMGSERDGGHADLTTGEFNATFTVQVVAPGLYDLVAKNRLDPTAVGPVRVLLTWEGRYTPEG